MNPSPFTAVIVDDEPLAVEGVRRLCVASALVTVIGEAFDGPSALELIDRMAPQGVFLDIAMPGMSGLNVAAALRGMGRPPLVVLVTANDHFATEAFDLAVVDYVLKPIDPDRLTRAIERVAAMTGDQGLRVADDHALWVPYRGIVIRLPVQDIRRVEAERDYVRIVDAERSYLLRATLSDIAVRLAPGFLRIHRSIIMARAEIAGVKHAGGGSWMAIDREGSEFPIGRTYLADVRIELALG